MNPNIAKGLANKVFALQRASGGSVPGIIMRSARLVRDGHGSASDVEAIRNYLGISKSGYSAAGRSTRSLNAAIERSSRFSTALDMAQRGQLGGYTQLAGMGVQEINKIVSSKAFEGALQKATDTLLSNPNKADRLLAGTKLAYSARRGVRALGAAISAIPLVDTALQQAYGITDQITGATQTSATRRAFRDASLAAVDPRMSPQRRELLTRQARSGQIADNFRNTIGGGYLAHLLKVKEGVDGATLANMSAKLYLQESGLGGKAEQIVAAARREALREMGGENYAARMTAMGFSKEQLDTLISQKVEERISDALELRERAQDAAGRREFTQAKELLKAADQAAPGSVAAWENPEEIYKQQLGGRAAMRLFSNTQITRAGNRTGD